MARILLCDDESIQRAALRISLERLTNLPLPVSEVQEAVHGRQAVDLVSSWRPDIVFLDLRMPVMGGMEAALTIRKMAPSVRIIILTAYDEFNFAQEAIQIGVCDYLLKPAGQSDLDRVLRKAMAEIQAEEEGRRQLDALRQRVELAKPLILQEYISDLLAGNSLDESALEEKRRFLELADHPRQVLVMQLSDFAQITAGQTEADRQLIKERVLLLAEREIGKAAALLHRSGHDRFTLLLPGLCGAALEAGEHLVIDLAERIRLAVNRELQIPLTIGIGRAVKSPVDLHQSFSDALQAVYYQASLGGNHVIHWQDMDQGVGCQALPAEEEAVLQAIRLGNRQQMAGQLEALLALLLQQESGKLEPLRWRLLELLVLLTRASILGGANAEQATQANVRHLGLITAAETPVALRQIVSQAASELLHLVMAERGLRHQRLIRRAIAYLEQHCHEPLSLEDVARVVYLSPFYFSHVFKEQTGVTFVQYLTELRLSTAKQLLRETDLAIGLIAERVGYSDVNYFSRVFKKSAALTPTEYRARMGVSER